MKWRNQLLALFCLVVFLGFGVFYFRYWVVQKPFGIILFVGEGLSPGRLAMTRIYAGGADKPLRIESLTYSALLRNYSNDSCIPDDAAAATALATGVKVNNGAVGIDAQGKALENLIELARASGRMTGIVTNGRLTSPTIASFYAHTNRKDDRESLARELVEKGNVDLLLGGGAEDFRPKTQGGKRADEHDLFSDMQKAGYDIVQTSDELDEIPRWRQAKLFGVFSEGDLPYASEEDESNRPSLADMVRRGIELLQFNSGGYLLVVDAGLMRKAVEENDAERTLAETVELDRAVSVASEYAGSNSTLIVCGDVALGGLILHGSTPRNISGPGLFEPDAMGEPRITWGITSNAIKPEPRPNEQMRGDATPVPEASESSSPLPEPIQTPDVSSTTLHQAFGDDVVAFGSGLGTDTLRGSLESTMVFEIIRDNL